MASQKTVTLGQGLTERQRTTSTGTKSRYTVEVKADQIDFNLSELVGKATAEAAKEVIKAQIQGITQTASTGTQLFRKSAAESFTKSSRWAQKRYSGGKTGPKEPGKSDRLFNDSGRFAEGLAAKHNQAEGSFTINVTANRLNPSTFKDGQAGVIAMYAQLVSLVPALGDPASLANSAQVQAAIAKDLANAVTKVDGQGNSARARLASELKRTAENVSDISEELADTEG